ILNIKKSGTFVALDCVIKKSVSASWNMALDADKSRLVDCQRNRLSGLPLCLLETCNVPLLATIAYSTIKATPQKTILACSTSDTWPTVFAKGPRKDSLRSSGESDVTNVILKINAVNVAKRLTRRQANEEGKLTSRFLKVL